MSKRLIAIRGAVSITQDETETDAMVQAIGELMDSLMEKNNLDHTDIVSIQFTQTSDLIKKNAATALRESRPLFGNTALFCSREPDIEGMLERVVRILITAYGTEPPQSVYLGKTKILRPDYS